MSTDFRGQKKPLYSGYLCGSCLFIWGIFSIWPWFGLSLSGLTCRSCSASFQVPPRPHRTMFRIYLWIWCVCGRSWIQNPLCHHHEPEPLLFYAVSHLFPKRICKYTHMYKYTCIIQQHKKINVAIRENLDLFFSSQIYLHLLWKRKITLVFYCRFS